MIRFIFQLFSSWVGFFGTRDGFNLGRDWKVFLEQWFLCHDENEADDVEYHFSGVDIYLALFPAMGISSTRSSILDLGCHLYTF